MKNRCCEFPEYDRACIGSPLPRNVHWRYTVTVLCPACREWREVPKEVADRFISEEELRHELWR